MPDPNGQPDGVPDPVVNIDTPTRTVTFSVKATRFDLKPMTLEVPFAVIKEIAAIILQEENEREAPRMDENQPRKPKILRPGGG